MIIGWDWILLLNSVLVHVSWGLVSYHRDSKQSGFIGTPRNSRLQYSTGWGPCPLLPLLIVRLGVADPRSKRSLWGRKRKERPNSDDPSRFFDVIRKVSMSRPNASTQKSLVTEALVHHLAFSFFFFFPYLPIDWLVVYRKQNGMYPVLALRHKLWRPLSRLLSIIWKH